MHTWRPKQNIQVKALGLVWRKGLLLASEIYLDDGTIKGVRPLGGHIEFGETWRDTLVREFKEELDVVVEPLGTPIAMENIYTHHGMVGHEITFIADVSFPEDAYSDDGPIEFYEDNGEKCHASWHDIETLDCGGLELYPSGLKTALMDRAKSE